MLVLSRKKEESIVINKDVVVTVLEIKGDRVRLGIEAPQEVGVHRYEVWKEIYQPTPRKNPPRPGARDLAAAIHPTFVAGACRPSTVNQPKETQGAGPARSVNSDVSAST